VARALGFVPLALVVYCLPFSWRPNILPRSNLTLTMKRSVLTFIAILIGAAFIVSCTQQGTTATSTTAATAKASPSPSPSKKKKTTAKKKAAETEASPSPSESASPAPTP
jgi:hypothetical protein